MVAPKWVSSRCQPIAIHDVLAALVIAVEDTESEDTISSRSAAPTC